MTPWRIIERGWIAGCVLAMALLLALPVRAEELSDAIAALGESDPKPAIQVLIQSDDVKAKAALQAMAAGKLFRRLSDLVDCNAEDRSPDRDDRRRRGHCLGVRSAAQLLDLHAHVSEQHVKEFLPVAGFRAKHDVGIWKNADSAAIGHADRG
jgi:hypothetical protein